MFFWTVLTVAAALGALHLSASDGGSSQALVLVAVFGLAMMLAGSARLLARFLVNGPSSAISGACVLGLAFLALPDRADLVAAGSLATAPAPRLAVSQTAREAELRRAWDGHYRADALVNGVEMRLLIDTGASMVVLPYEAVERMGIDPKTLDYNLPVTTANGSSTVAPIRLASISVGPVEVTDVRAAVAHPGRLEAGLLGMSFLEKIDETVFQGDRLILRQNAAPRDSRFKRAPRIANSGVPAEAPLHLSAPD